MKKKKFELMHLDESSTQKMTFFSRKQAEKSGFYAHTPGGYGTPSFPVIFHYKLSSPRALPPLSPSFSVFHTSSSPCGRKSPSPQAGIPLPHTVSLITHSLGTKGDPLREHL